VVHVKLKNSGSSDFNYSQFDFKVTTSAGNVTDSTFPPSTYTANQELNSGALAPGGAAEGDVILEAPIGDHQAELSWQPSFFSQSTDNLWNLGL
jgi:hypothetical protein